MNHIKNLLCAAIIVACALFAIGPPVQAQAAPSTVEQDQFSCANVTEIPQSQCEALVALYNPETNRPYNWLETTTPCSWSSITCRSGHVAELSLSENQLSSLPSQIVQLVGLGFFSAGDNYLAEASPEVRAFLDAKDPDWATSQIAVSGETDTTSVPPNMTTSPMVLFLPLIRN